MWLQKQRLQDCCISVTSNQLAWLGWAGQVEPMARPPPPPVLCLVTMTTTCHHYPLCLRPPPPRNTTLRIDTTCLCPPAHDWFYIRHLTQPRSGMQNYRCAVPPARPSALYNYACKHFAMVNGDDNEALIWLIRSICILVLQLKYFP